MTASHSQLSPISHIAPAPAKDAASSGERAWITRPEKGTLFGARLLLFTSRVLGRRGVGIILRVVALYYALFTPAARRASDAYFERLGASGGFWAYYRRVFAFARSSFDRALLVQGKIDPFVVRCEGQEHLARLHAEGRGAILLGAHVGSFEAMRAIGDAQSFTINILTYWENARMISGFLAEVGADFNTRVIPIRPDDPSFVFAVRDAIERGEFVAVLGDRVGLGEKTVEAEFLGARARFPAGPYTLAAVLRCPVYLTFGLYEEPNLYHLYCEPFAERLELPRGARQRALQQYAQRYADRLEHYCRQAPDNWFNFFDFWGEG